MNELLPVFGAAGSALGAVLGAIIMQTIHNGGTLLGVDRTRPMAT